MALTVEEVSEVAVEEVEVGVVKTEEEHKLIQQPTRGGKPPDTPIYHHLGPANAIGSLGKIVSCALSPRHVRGRISPSLNHQILIEGLTNSV